MAFNIEDITNRANDLEFINDRLARLSLTVSKGVVGVNQPVGKAAKQSSEHRVLLR